MRKAPKGGALDPIDEEINRIIAMGGGGVPPPPQKRGFEKKKCIPFCVLKRQFGHVKTRPTPRCWPRTGRSCSRCSRSATCSWSHDGCWREDESVRNRRKRSPKRLKNFAKKKTHGETAKLPRNESRYAGKSAVPTSFDQTFLEYPYSVMHCERTCEPQPSALGEPRPRHHQSEAQANRALRENLHCGRANHFP